MISTNFIQNACEKNKVITFFISEINEHQRLNIQKLYNKEI